jgi:hypothetical protein
MTDLLRVLDNINNRRAITAEQLGSSLKLGYAVWMRGYLELTPYGQTVLDTMAKAA